MNHKKELLKGPCTTAQVNFTQKTASSRSAMMAVQGTGRPSEYYFNF